MYVQYVLQESRNSQLIKQVPMNAQAQAFLIKCRTTQPSSPNLRTSLPLTISIVSTQTTSGATAPIAVDTTSNTYLPL